MSDTTTPAMVEPLYFEDITVGDRRASGTVTVTEEMIIAFGRSFDPQPFHTDPQAAPDTFFGELVASGWHTASLTMRLLVDARVLGGSPLVGAGVEAIRWPRPTRPNDVLRVETEVIERLPPGRRPDLGMIRVQIITRRADDAVVQSMVTRMVLPRREPASA